jgi:hypothetical protein
MEVPIISMPKNHKTSLLKCEDHGLSFSAFVELCIVNLFLQEQTVNQNYYIDTLLLSGQKCAGKGPEKWNVRIGFYTMTPHLLTLFFCV